MKKTKWFPACVKPINKGWYDIRYRNEKKPVKRYWFDGSVWLYWPEGGLSLWGNTETRGETWRGLAEKPE